MTRQEFKLDNDLKKKAIAFIMAKGLGVTVLVAWIVMLTMQLNKLQDRVDILTDSTIKENTKALYEFNLRNQKSQQLPFNP